MQTLMQKPESAWIVSGDLFKKVTKDMHIVDYSGKVEIVKIEEYKDKEDGKKKLTAYTWLKTDYFDQGKIDELKKLDYNIVLISAGEKGGLKFLLELPKTYDFKKAFDEYIERLMV